MLLAIRLKHAQRSLNLTIGFCAYHIVKFFLWRKGYGATFFYKTRLLSIPILAGALWYNTFRWYPLNLKQAGVIDYAAKARRFTQDMETLKKFMSGRKDYHDELKKDVQTTTNINSLVNFTSKATK